MTAAMTMMRAAQPVTISEVELYAWIAQAEAGARLAYHVGFLVMDATPGLSLLPEPDRRRLAALASAALAAFDKGLVHLVQERLGPDRFAYVAVARPRKKPAAAAALSALLEAQAA